MIVIEEIKAERLRQIAKGYDAAHDDEHAKGEIAQAAATLALYHIDRPTALNVWPWGPDGWRAGTPRGDLIKAAAMLVAEVERLDRIPPKLCEVCGHPGATLHVEFDGFACAECQASWERPECLHRWDGPLVETENGGASRTCVYCGATAANAIKNVECDCENPEPASGVALVSEDCPIHGGRS